ncbi:hypothetical protein V1525DRAFT_340867 [Lipomyces kononenkoae]|uniref:Uncharacterized protein n=1 Tax=Lipomyces kononenkoae TaxID=34357 RepID=A0ACC3T501_LIPKO
MLYHVCCCCSLIGLQVPPLLSSRAVQEDHGARGSSLNHGFRPRLKVHATSQLSISEAHPFAMPRSYPLEHSVSAPGQMSSSTTYAPGVVSSTISTSSTASSSSTVSSLAPPTPSTLLSNRPPLTGSSLFHISLTLISRLASVHGLAVYLAHARIPSPTDTSSMLFSASYFDTAMTSDASSAGDLHPKASPAARTASNDIDPVTQLWRFLRQGTSLCVLFNALNRYVALDNGVDSSMSSDLIVPDPHVLAPSEQDLKTCKRGVYEFVNACKSRLRFADDDLFTVTNVFSDDTTHLLQVARTVNLVLDMWEVRRRMLGDGDYMGTFEEEILPKTDGADPEPGDLRSKVMQELLQTERKYVQDLELLQGYMKQLQLQEIVSADTIHFLFPNLNTLVDCQRKFLVGIETNARLPPAAQRLGALFLSMEPPFSVYETYASQQKQASDIAIQEAPKLAKLKDMIEPTYELPSILIKPIQRICKYPLLLKELLKYTPEDDEYYGELHEGFHAMKRVATRVNETQRQTENKQVALSLCARIDDWKGHKIEHFGDLLYDGLFQCVEDEKEYHYYLFENILLFCKEDTTPSALHVGGRGSSSGSSNGNSVGAGLGSGLSSTSLSTITPALGGTATTKKKKHILQSSVGKKSSFPSFISSHAAGGGGSLTFEGRLYVENIIDVTTTTTKASFGDPIFQNGYVLTIYWKLDTSDEVKQYSIRFRSEETLHHWQAAIRRVIAARRRLQDATASQFTPYHGRNMSSTSTFSFSQVYTQFPSHNVPRPLSASSSSSVSMSPPVHRVPSSQPQAPHSRPQPNTIKIKLSFQNDSYLVLLAAPASFKDVVNKIEKKLRICNASAFNDIVASSRTTGINGLGYRLKYRDEDGDLVVLDDEDDWDVATDSRQDDGVVEIWVV